MKCNCGVCKKNKRGIKIKISCAQSTLVKNIAKQILDEIDNEVFQTLNKINANK